MKLNVKKEIPIWIIILLPLVYLAFIWSDLPAEVPMHWNVQGEVDRYGSKMELLAVVFFLPVLLYGIFAVIPLIDPKKQIERMGGKYHNLKFLLVAFASALSIFILYASMHPVKIEPKLVIAGVGLLFMILGNYFKTIQPNYFVGIRTPWTLENAVVWKDTHKMAGVLWLFGGLLLAILSLILGGKATLIVTFIITGTLVIVPFAYSYFRFKQIDGQLSD